MSVVVVDGRQPEVEEVVVVMEGAELKQSDDRAVVVVALSLLVLEQFEKLCLFQFYHLIL